MINTKDVKKNSGFGTSRFLGVGQYKVKINNIEAYESATGSFQFKFGVETEPVLEEGFVPLEGYKGRVGTIKTLYLANPVMEDQVAATLANLGFETGTKELMDAISPDLSYPEYASTLTDILKDKWVWVSICGKEYLSAKTGKKGVELNFPRFKAFASDTTKEKLGDKALAESRLKTLPTTENEVAVEKGEQLDWNV